MPIPVLLFTSITLNIIKKKKKRRGFCTTTGQPAFGALSERRPPNGFRPAYSTSIHASIPMAS